jgi:hypothetical protein
MKISIRDLLLATAIIAILAGWWVDRSNLVATHARTVSAAERLRSMLDKADPGWRDRPVPQPIAMKPASSAGGYVLGTGLVAMCILIVVLVWKGYIHPSILEEHRRF